MEQGEMRIQEVLETLLRDDRQILGRRDELLEKLNEHIGGAYWRDYVPIRIAIQDNDIGELLLVADNGTFEEKETAKDEAMDRLLRANMQEKRAKFVVNAIVKALHWSDKDESKTIHSYKELYDKIGLLNKKVKTHEIIQQELEENIKRLEIRLIERDKKIKNDLMYAFDKIEAQSKIINTLLKKIERNRDLEKELKKIYIERVLRCLQHLKSEISKQVSKKVEENSLGKKGSMLALKNEFNSIQGLSGFSSWEARRCFLEKYKVIGFKCINREERIKNHNIRPEFAIDDSVNPAELWGIKYGKYYLLLPNMKQYVYADHNAGAMGELFTSNFMSMYKYKKIELDIPAVLSHDLKIIKRGKLKLSNTY